MLNHLIPNTFLITLLLLPGIAWSLIWMKYSKTRPQTDKFYFSVYALVASVFCYGLVSLWFGMEKVVELFQQNLVNKDGTKIILCALGVSLIIGAFSVFGSHKKWIVRFMQWRKITYWDGEEYIWEASLRATMGSKSYIKIYDFRRDFIYFGFVDQISEGKIDKELVLLEVEIFSNSTGKIVKKMDRLYLVFDHKDFLIQFFN